MATTDLDISLFTKVSDDLEARQYTILATLKAIGKEFQQNKIYPNLSKLISTYQTLSDINNRLNDLRSRFPKRIKKIDFVNREIEHEVIFVDGSDVQKVEELISWALPHIQQKIEEGTTIYEFVDDEIALEEVGIMPSYVDEGYLFVPHNAASTLLLFKYEISIFKSAQDKYRSLKTRFLKSIAQGEALLSPNAIKLDLLNDFKDLPNPATFSFQTALDFPFGATIFPVAKRKLLHQLVQ